jgi:hypothetical protein
LELFPFQALENHTCKVDGQSTRFGTPCALNQNEENRMSIQQRMQNEKAEMAVRRKMQKAIEQFCRKRKLKADKREETIQFIADDLELRDMLAVSLASPSPATVLTHAKIKSLIIGYLTEFLQEMDSLVTELNSLSKQAKGELTMLRASD